MAAFVQLPARTVHRTLLLVSLLGWAAGFALPHINVQFDAKPGTVIAELQNQGQRFEQDEESRKYFKVTGEGALVTRRPLTELLESSLVVSVTHVKDSHSWTEPIHLRIVNSGQGSRLHFADSRYEGFVAEGNDPGERVLGLDDLRAAVPVYAEGMPVAYRLHGPGSQSFYLVVPERGETVQVFAIDTLDAASADSYRLILEAVVNGELAETTVKIAVLGAHPPAFVLDPFVFSVREEDTAAGRAVGSVHATDEDRGESGRVTYRLDAPSPYFTINAETGAISPAAKLQAGDYEVRVVARDGGAQSSESSPALVVVTVLPASSNKVPYGDDMLFGPPQAGAERKPQPQPLRQRREALDEVAFALPEDTAAGTVVYTVDNVNASDRFALAEPANHLFAVGETTGEVSLAGQLDHEESATQVFEIEITNVDDAAKLDTQRFVVTVEDVDEPPQWEMIVVPYIEVVPVDAPSGASIYELRASDPEGTPVHYYLRSGGSGKFTVDEDSGWIQTTFGQTYEEGMEYVLSVYAQDGNSSEVSAEVTIFGGTHPPQFTQEVYQASVTEEVDGRQQVIEVQAFSFNNLAVTYSLVGNDPRVPSHTIDATSGVITLMVKVDREVLDAYHLEVQAMEDSTNGMSVTARVNVDVVDIDDCSPVFQQATFTIRGISEDVSTDTSIATVFAIDCDDFPNNVLTYSLGGPDAGKFRLTPDTGDLYPAVGLDYDTGQPFYQLMATVRDQAGGQDTASLWVYLENVNDEAPVFLNTDGMQYFIDEDAPNGYKVGTVYASDADPDSTITFAMQQSATFQIDPQSGVISRQGSGNLPEASYRFNVTATDGTFTTHAEVNIEVNDINDNTPEFPDCASYTPSIPEDSPENTFVLQVTATDADKGTNAEITYNIPGANIPFEIDKVTGDITTRDQLDRESAPTVDIVVSAKDNPMVVSGNTGFCRITITITDVNDIRPKFLLQEYFAFVSPDATLLGVFLNVTAEDADLDSRITYSLSSQPSPFRFGIDQSGGIYPSDSLADQSGEITLKVKADDSYLHSETEVRVMVTTNVNTLPDWGSPWKPETVLENATARTIITTVNATSSSQIGYGIVHGQVPATNSELQFSVFNQGSGVNVLVINPLDYETTKEYQLVLRAFNDGNRQEALQTLTVLVEDVNDEAPQFPVDVVFTSVSEEDRDLTIPITTVTAVDKDTVEEYRTVRYFLDETYIDWQHFTVDETTGEIYSDVYFDHELKSAYGIQIIAKDSAPSSFSGLNGEPNIASVRVTINVVDINDNEPIFDEDIYTVDVLEDAAVGFEVVQIQAQDRDSDSIRYLITANNTGGAFDVNPELGKIFIASRLDYEAKAEYWLQYTANDGLNFATVPVRIRLTNVNDEVPVFDQDLYQLNVDEEDDNFPRDLIQVSAQDGDAGADQASIRYSLEGIGAGDEFTIDPTSGQIRLNSKLDREERSQWNFQVKATDELGAGRTGSADVEVAVNDINDNDPYFPDLEYRGSVEENSPAGTPVLQVEAVDLDDPLTHGKITYSVVSDSGIEDDGADLFDVDPNSGQVTVKPGANLDREAKDSYNLKIQASDNVGGSADTDAVIQILDVNDNRPMFVGGPFSTAVPETLAVGATVYEIPAADADSDFNDLVLFTIESGNVGNKFEIAADPISLVGIVRIADPLDYEAGPEVYTLALRVRDNPDAGDQTTLTVRVQDVNDVAPQFQPSSDYVADNVREDVPVGTLIHTVTATDVEAGDAGRFTFEIDPSTDPDSLFVVSAPIGSGATRTAEVRTRQLLDRETVETHRLTLLATDQGVPPLTGTATLTLTLDDVNDTPPRFAEDYEPFIRENLAEVQFVATVSAVDDDITGGGPFSFDVVTNGDTDSFTWEDVGENRFSIYTKAISFDREEQAFYTIPIRITETSPGGNTGVSDLVVEVQDENDNPHTGITKEMLVYSFEGMIPDSPIGHVGVSDPDTIEDKTYIPQGNLPAEYFQVDSDTGLVTILAGTPAGVYSFEVVVQDDGTFPDQESTVVVDVRDIPEEAVRSSGSFRFEGTTAEELVALPADGSPSKVEVLKTILADIIPAKPENIDIFGIVNVDGAENQVDVRYSAHGSPFYPPEKMDGAALENRDRIEKELGVTIGMVKIDMCLQESACESACTNVLEIDPQPTVVNTPSASFTSITTRTVAKCVCGAQLETPGPCDYDACANGGTCTDTQGGGHTCSCPSGFDGPDCQQTTREFRGGFAHFATLQQCELTHTSLEFITTAAEGVLLYNGPMTPVTGEAPQDFLLLQLDAGKPVLHIDLGSGVLSLTIPSTANLADGKWHRLDIYRNGKEVEFMLDRCKDATIAEASSSTDRQTVGCKVNGTSPGDNKFLNVNTPLQLGGRDLSSAFTYPEDVAFAGSYTGCMKNVEQDGKLYDLQRPGKAQDSDPGCSQLKCGECNAGKCVGDFSTYTCLCDPGFFGTLCDKETPAYDFAAESYVRYRLTDQARLNSREGNYQVTFRTREKEGLLLTITNTNGLEFTTVELINGFVRSRWNLGDGENSVYLDGYPVDDGDWHTVHFERFDFYVTVRVDGGGGVRQAESSTSTFSTLEADPNSLLLGAFVVRVVEISQDFQGCMNDPRINNFYLGFDGETVYGTAQPSDGVTEGCPSYDPCLSNPCPAPFVCVDLWRKYTCGCADGFYEEDGTCLDLNECMPNPCLNGGKCQDLVNGFQCTCVGDYKGEICEMLFEPYVGPALALSVGAIIAMILCLLLIILMLLLFVFYKRNQDRKQALAFAVDPDDDIRENFINYDEEGGGEEDQDAYDVSTLRKPVHPQPVDDYVKPPTTAAPLTRAPRAPGDDPNVGDFINDRLKDADDDPDGSPNDSLREFDFEGEGSSAGTLSSLNSSSTDGDQNYDYLNDWGPPFKKLADMYGGGDED